MSNKNKYHFGDFTEKNYKKLVKIAKKNYQFATYQNYKDFDNFIIWRHDVDSSVHRAKKIAQIDKDEGILSTFFFLLHSEFYNVLEKEIRNLILEIAAIGHHIGIHFDVHFYENLTEKNLKEHLLFEKKIFEELFSQKINVFSFHNPTEKILKWNKETYQGMVNAYNFIFRKDVHYVSDSNGYWRFQRLEDVLTIQRPSRLQVLTHPEWWQQTLMSPFERVKRSIKGRAGKTLAHYEGTLKKFGRENIDW